MISYFFQAYWLLDNEDFDEAMAMLLDPLVHTSDISDEEHRSVMIGLLTQGHPKLALKYCNVRKPPQRKPVDIQLHISILLANGNFLKFMNYLLSFVAFYDIKILRHTYLCF